MPNSNPQHSPQHQPHPLPPLAGSSWTVTAAVTDADTPTGTEMLAPESARAGELSFTADYFRCQIAECWRLSGERSFWRDPRAVDKAARAIGYVYLHLDHKPTLNEESMLNGALINLTMRQALIESRPPEWMSTAR